MAQGKKILVLLESPGKIATISKILGGLHDGNTYTVKASMGHITRIADIGKYKMGIDLTTMEETYEILSNKKAIVKELKGEVKLADTVYLASDGDTEGNKIADAWITELKIPKKKYARVIFREITEKGVENGIANAGELDTLSVESARCRAELDKIIGYRLSPLSLSKIGAPSCGRVQSAALRILADREHEILSFIPKEYYEIYLPFTKNKKEYTAQYKGTATKKIVTIPEKNDTEKVVSECISGNYIVKNIVAKNRKVQSKLPFTTSTFQQEVSSKLGYNPSRSMQLAQKLYEQGLITYMRTDSVRLSDDFVTECKTLIEKDYGKKYYKGLHVSSKENAKAQDAHESIRPAHLEKTPSLMKLTLEPMQYKVYKIIYTRTLASLMVDSIIIDTNVEIFNGVHKFVLTGHQEKLDGYKKIYKEYEDEEDVELLPSFSVDEKITDKPLDVQHKQTNPPTRYSEASLIKELEHSGIGRPSTFSPTIENLKKRHYVEMEKKVMVVSDVGIRLDAMLREYFPDVINTTYTAKMEEMLDKIADGTKDRVTELTEFYTEFAPTVLKANREMNKDKAKPELTDKICPNCGAPLVMRHSNKTGKDFYACSKFPKCKYTVGIVDPNEPPKPKAEITDIVCPKCGKGKLVKRTSRKGEVFYGCTDFRNGCHYTMKETEFNETYKSK